MEYKFTLQLFGGRGAGSGGAGGNGRFQGTAGATRQGASDDWFEYENANAMSEFIRTGKMPTTDINGNRLSMEQRERLAHEANLMQEEAQRENTGQKTLYRGMVMSESEARALTPGETYTTRTLTATTPDRKLATVYSDVDNFGGGEGVPVMITFQKPDGICGFKRDGMETVLPKGANFRILRNYMSPDGIVHIDLYAKKGIRKNQK